MAEQIIGKGSRTKRPNIPLFITYSQSQTLVANEECIRWGKKQKNSTPAAAIGMPARTGAHKCESAHVHKYTHAQAHTSAQNIRALALTCTHAQYPKTRHTRPQTHHANKHVHTQTHRIYNFAR